METNTLKVLTCNIRTSTASDGENGWDNRKDICVNVIKKHSPDIVCFQEMQTNQFAHIKSLFPAFRFHALMDTPEGRTPTNCIFYRKRFKKISAGGFWLSETPHVAGSKSWDSKCIRLSNWVRLEDPGTDIEFRVVNTHLDHISQPARERQARMIAEDSDAFPADYPQVLTGDMNCDFRNPAIKSLKAAGWVDTYCRVHGTEDPGPTYHAFQGSHCSPQVGKMDWIFQRGCMKTERAEILRDSNAAGDRFPSDHYFVSAELSFSI